MEALERSGALNKDGKSKEALLQSGLDVCVKEECKPPGTFKDDIRKLKAQLEEFDKKYHGALVRARAEWFLLGEAPTKGALSSEKRYAHKNTIVEIEHDGATTRQASNVASVTTMRSCLLVSLLMQCSLKTGLCLLPCLSEEKTANIESDITVDEIRRAIAN